MRPAAPHTQTNTHTRAKFNHLCAACALDFAFARARRELDEQVIDYSRHVSVSLPAVCVAVRCWAKRKTAHNKMQFAIIHGAYGTVMYACMHAYLY